MNEPDGRKILPGKVKHSIRYETCTRWNELKDTVHCHIQLAGLLGAPTKFRLLNDPGKVVGSQKFGIFVTGNAIVDNDVQNAMNIMSRARPGGFTHLSSHLREIHEQIQALKPKLEAEGQRVAVILATDGLPTDSQGRCTEFGRAIFVENLRQLEGLPVWVVIRLCTDEESVLNFYNSLDDELELSIDVLDDFEAEADEVYSHNKWLTYSLSLHRLREMGFYDRTFDMLDERALTKDELRDFCSLLFGIGHVDGLPDPSIDWKGFVKYINRLLKEEELQWNPKQKRMTPYLDLKEMNSIYGDGSECSIM